MDELRTLIQSKLEEIQDLEVTPEIPDSMLEANKVYFSFSLQKNYINGDFDKNYTYRVSITGYLKMLENPEINTLQITDNLADMISNKLKELNITSNYYDITVIDGIRKKQITGEVIYNEINKGLV